MARTGQGWHIKSGSDKSEHAHAAGSLLTVFERLMPSFHAPRSAQDWMNVSYGTSRNGAQGQPEQRSSARREQSADLTIGCPASRGIGIASTSTIAMPETSSAFSKGIDCEIHHQR
jgi:hypothetical protein